MRVVTAASAVALRRVADRSGAASIVCAAFSALMRSTRTWTDGRASVSGVGSLADSLVSS
jgi:hypothetical protein